MKRSNYGTGAFAITPDLPRPGDTGLKCQRCTDKQEHISHL